MVSSHHSGSSGSSEDTVTNTPGHSPTHRKAMSFPQTSSTGLYTAYTLIPIPVDNRADAAKYFCTYRGCAFRFDTPCDLQRHRIEGKCSPIWNTPSNSDALNGNTGGALSSGFLRCQLCYDYIASCNYRPLIEHIRTEHCGLPNVYLPSSVDHAIPGHEGDSFNALTDATDPTMTYDHLSFHETQSSYVHNHDFFEHSQMPTAPVDQQDFLDFSLNQTHASPDKAVTSNIMAPQINEPSDRKGRGAGTAALDWEKYKSELQRLYVEEDNNLEQVMGYMSTTYGFNAK